MRWGISSQAFTAVLAFLCMGWHDMVMKMKRTPMTKGRFHDWHFWRAGVTYGAAGEDAYDDDEKGLESDGDSLPYAHPAACSDQTLISLSLIPQVRTPHARHALAGA